MPLADVEIRGVRPLAQVLRPLVRGAGLLRYDDAALGELAHLGDGRRQPLTSETVVGRGPSADLRLEQDFVSNLHAALTWADNSWGIRDLGSHNGTGVNGDPLAPGTRRRLQPGDEVSFGQASATWTLVDASEPAPFATRDGHDPVAGSNGLLVLPDDDDPVATIYFGSNGSWRIDDGSDARDINDRATISVGETQWTIRLPASLTTTRASTGSRRRMTLRDVALSIAAEEDERGGSVVVRPDDGESFSFPVGTNLSVLELLARARLADDSGWIDRVRVLEDLAMTGNRLNVIVFRLRRQFTDAGFVDGAQIVERGHRRLRLGTDRVALQ